MSTTGWRKSRRSANLQHCVEIAPTPDGVQLRDTKDHGAGPIITFTPDQWAAFLREVATATPGANGAVTVRTVGAATHLHAHGTDVTLRFTEPEWAAFSAGVRDGEFDLLRK